MNDLSINSNILTMKVFPVGSFPSSGVTKYFAINAVGDWIDETHVLNVVHFLKKNMKSGENPNAKIESCAVYSQNLELMELFSSYAGIIGLPVQNIQKIYRDPALNNPKPIVPDGCNKIFSIYTKEYLEQQFKSENPDLEIKSIKDFINCGERCLDCLNCYKPGETIIKEMI